MNFVIAVKEKLIKELSLIEEELKFYSNLDIDEVEKINKVTSLLEMLVIKEQALLKWDKVTKPLNNEDGTN